MNVSVVTSSCTIPQDPKQVLWIALSHRSELHVQMQSFTDTDGNPFTIPSVLINDCTDVVRAFACHWVIGFLNRNDDGFADWVRQTYNFYRGWDLTLEAFSGVGNLGVISISPPTQHHSLRFCFHPRRDGSVQRNGILMGGRELGIATKWEERSVEEKVRKRKR